MALGGVAFDPFGRPVVSSTSAVAQATTTAAAATAPSISSKGGTPPEAAPNITPAPAAAPVDVRTTAAYQSIVADLAAVGLTDPAFAQIVYNDYVNGRTDESLIKADIRASDAYKTLFPNADKLMAQGIISNEGQYLSALSSYRDLNHRYGIPASYDSATDISTLLLGHVNPQEWEQRLSGAQSAALAGIDPTTRAELQRSLGVTTGDLTAVWLNPNENLGHLQQNFQAGLIGAQSDLTGFGSLDEQTLQELAARGITTDQARSGFAQAAQDRMLNGFLPGQTQQQLDQNTLIQASLGGNAAAQAQVEALRRQRLGAFSGGGQAAIGQGGVAGLAPNAT